MKLFCKRHSSFLVILFFLVVSILIILPFLSCYNWGALIPFSTFDEAFHLESIQDSYLALKNCHLSQIFPGIATKTFGSFGYPLYSFYPILTFLPEIFLHLLFQNAWFSFLAFMGLVFFLIMESMFICSSRMFHSKTAGFFSSIIYVFSPIILDFYSGPKNISLLISFIFIPMAFYGVYEIIIGNPKKWFWFSIGISLICFTHVLSFIITSFLIFLIALFLLFENENIKQKLKRVIYLFISCIVGALLSASFSIPFLFNNINLGGTATGSNPANLWQNSLGFSDLLFGGIPSTNYSFILYAGFGLITLIVLFSLFITFKKLPKFFKYLVFLIFVTALLSTKLFPWQLLNGSLNVLQFPIRILTITYFLIALVGGFSISLIFKSKKQFFIFSVVLLIIGLFTNTELIIQNNYTEQNNMGNFELKPNLTDKQLQVPVASNSQNQIVNSQVSGLITPEQFEKYGDQYNTLEYIPENSIPIQTNLYSHSIKSMNPHLKGLKQTHWSTSYNAIHYRITSKKSISKLALPNIYYPGFHAYVNNKEVPIHVGKQHQIEIPVKKGKDKINLIYRDTTLKVVSNIISAVTWIGLIGYLLFRWIRNKLTRNDNVPKHAK